MLLRWVLPVVVGCSVWYGVSVWLCWYSVAHFSLYQTSPSKSFTFCGSGLLLKNPTCYFDFASQCLTLAPKAAAFASFHPTVHIRLGKRNGDYLLPYLSHDPSGEKSLYFWNVTQNRIEPWKTWQNPTQVLLSDDLSTLIEFTPFSQNLLFALAPSGLASSCGASFHLSNFFFPPPPSDQWGVILAYNWDLPACRLRSCFGISPISRLGERIHLSADGQWLLVGTRLSNDKYSTVSYAPHGFLFWPSTESKDICLRAVSTQDGAEQTVPVVDPSSWYATLLKNGHIIHVQNDGAGKVVRLVNTAANQVIPLNNPGNGRVSVWMNGEDC